MKLIWSPLALERAEEMVDRIAADRPVGAQKWLDELFGSVERLIQFPESGRVVPELNRANLREIIHGSSRIIYRIEAGDITILTVRNSRQLTEFNDLT